MYNIKNKGLRVAMTTCEMRVEINLSSVSNISKEWMHHIRVRWSSAAALEAQMWALC